MANARLLQQFLFELAAGRRPPPVPKGAGKSISGEPTGALVNELTGKAERGPGPEQLFDDPEQIIEDMVNKMINNSMRAFEKELEKETKRLQANGAGSFEIEKKVGEMRAEYRKLLDSNIPRYENMARISLEKAFLKKQCNSV